MKLTKRFVNGEKIGVRQTKNKGKGLFARADIRKGERIFVFEGKIVKDCYDSRYKTGVRWLGVGNVT